MIYLVFERIMACTEFRGAYASLEGANERREQRIEERVVEATEYARSSILRGVSLGDLVAYERTSAAADLYIQAVTVQP